VRVHTATSASLASQLATRAAFSAKRPEGRSKTHIEAGSLAEETGFVPVGLPGPEPIFLTRWAARSVDRSDERFRRKWDQQTLWGGRRGNGNFVAAFNRWSAAMPQPNDLSRSLVALDQNNTIIAVVELSQSSWLVAGMLPGIERQPCKKLEPRPERLLALLHRWRDDAVRAGKEITRIALAFEAGRDGFWLARWLAARGIEAHVIHASSLAVSREHRRAKTDRLDTELLKRGSLEQGSARRLDAAKHRA
jgi:hypothetical protein